MNVKEISNLVNFGLVVLVWLVQLVIYPGFQYYSNENLLKWHESYTPAISIVVMPLMLSQLFISGYLTLTNVSIINISLFTLVLSTWLITFIYAVPAHGKISEGTDINNQVTFLIRMNWSRTIIWTSIFILGLFSSQKIYG